MGGRGSKSSRAGGGGEAVPDVPAGPTKEVQEKLAKMTPSQQKTYATVASYGAEGTTSRVAGIHIDSLEKLRQAGLVRDTGRKAEPPGWKKHREKWGSPKREITVYVAVK